MPQSPSALHELHETLRELTLEINRLRWTATSLALLLLVGGVGLLVQSQLSWFHYR
ncbi:MAG: hypothetical protein ACJAZO_001410 [Myxococcota bacterium]|jgi:hypothetical protein